LGLAGKVARVYGLTGGIASGKSEVARMLRELGAPVVDADVIARRVVEPGQPAHEDIVREFGREVLAPDGTLDRARLAAIVFSDEAKRRRLNAIVHPRVAAASHREIAAHVAAGARVVVYEVPLLVENGLHRVLDGTIVVAVPEEVQLARAMARDGQGEAAARARIAAQLPLAAKLEVATHVIDNSGTLEETRRQVEELWRTLNEP
jgi:dephospho-CoA kinase